MNNHGILIRSKSPGYIPSIVIPIADRAQKVDLKEWYRLLYTMCQKSYIPGFFL